MLEKLNIKVTLEFWNGKRIVDACNEGKEVLFITIDNFTYYTLHNLTVIEPLSNITGHTYDVIVYDVPTYNRIEELLEFAEWVKVAVQVTLRPGGQECNYTYPRFF